jgi:uncharacterized membrane protein
MSSTYPPSSPTYASAVARPVAVAIRRPIHPALVPVPVACFVGALLTDIAYWRSANLMWANFSDWLLAAAMVTSVILAVAMLVDVVTRRIATNWSCPVFGAYMVAFVLGLFNAIVHSRDGWTSVVPTGLALSVATVLVLVVAGWLNWSRQSYVQAATLEAAE